MDIKLNCTIDDETILHKFKNIKLALGIETKYNHEYSDEYLLLYPIEDEVEVNIDTEYIEPNIIYSNSNIQTFFNKDNPYYYYIGKTHQLKRTIFISYDNCLFNLFNKVLIAKGLIKKGNKASIVVTNDMRTAIKNTVVKFGVSENIVGNCITVNVKVFDETYKVDL